MKIKKYIFGIILVLLVINIFQIKSFGNTITKNKENGIYKFAVGRDPSKTLEIEGGSKENGALLDIRNYRKSIKSKISY